MAAKKIQTLVLKVPKSGYRSKSAAEYIAQLDDLTERMWSELKDATPAELAWQSAPGHNTIGMLLAHCAVVEVFWLLVATGRASQEALRDTLGIDGDDDGMPLPPGGKPPKTLKGWKLADYRKLMKRARAFVTKETKRFGDAALEEQVRRTRFDGRKQIVSRRWILYHVLEHFSGHYGQMLMLRHLYRDAQAGKRARR